MKLFHASDIHLGRRRLEGRLPDSDLAEAFDHIAGKAIVEKADVFLLAGDLFDRPQVEPTHLRQAEEVLARLREAGIPVLAIEGNHDKAFMHSQAPTWVRYLADEDLLILLKPAFDSGGAVPERWDPATRAGAWIDIGGIRFTGAGYLGAATPNKVRQILSRLEGEQPHVLLLHAGPDYFVGEGGGFSRADLEALEDRVCYLALGHIHRPMLYRGWACNPGSPENCNLREAGYDLDEKGDVTARGYAVVEIDPNYPVAPRSLEIRTNPRRPCQRLELDCTSFGNKRGLGQEMLIAAAVRRIRECAPPAETVVDLHLRGNLNLKRFALDTGVAAGEIAEQARVFAVAVNTVALNITAGEGVTVGGEDLPLSRDELERAAIRSLVEGEEIWGIGDDHSGLVDFLHDLKEAVRCKVGAEELAARLLSTPLVTRMVEGEPTAGEPMEAMVGEDEEPSPEEMEKTWVPLL